MTGDITVTTYNSSYPSSPSIGVFNSNRFVVAREEKTTYNASHFDIVARLFNLIPASFSTVVPTQSTIMPTPFPTVVPTQSTAIPTVIPTQSPTRMIESTWFLSLLGSGSSLLVILCCTYAIYRYRKNQNSPGQARQEVKKKPALKTTELSGFMSLSNKTNHATLKTSPWLVLPSVATGQVSIPLLQTDDDVPKDYYCPISLCIMRQPVLAADGHVYERTAIEHWLQLKNTSPKTNQQLKHKQLTPYTDLQKTIDDFLRQYPQYRQERYFPTNWKNAIKQACVNADLDAIQLWIKRDASLFTLPLNDQQHTAVTLLLQSLANIADVLTALQYILQQTPEAITTVDDKGNNLLSQAVCSPHNDNLKIVQSLLRIHPLTIPQSWLLQTNQQGQTVYHLASQYASVTMLQYLQKALPKPPFPGQDKQGQTPLHIAAKRGDLDIVKQWTRYFDNLATDQQGRTPLLLARDHPNVFAWLCQQFVAQCPPLPPHQGKAIGVVASAPEMKADNAEAIPDKYRCPLTKLIMSQPVLAADGNTYELEAIKKSCTQKGWISPITQKALSHHHLTPIVMLRSEIQEFIKKEGVDQEMIFLTTDLKKEMINALNQGDVEKMKTLHQRDARLLTHPLQANQETAMHLMFQSTPDHCMLDVLHYILAQTFQYSDQKGNSLLSLACKSGAIKVVTNLLNQPQSVVAAQMVINQAGQTPFHAALTRSDELSLTLLKALVKAYPNVNLHQADNNGWTPLHLSAKYGHVKTTQWLLSMGADCLSTTSLPVTPLSLARQHPNCLMVIQKALLKRRQQALFPHNKQNASSLFSSFFTKKMAPKPFNDYEIKEDSQFNFETKLTNI